MKLIDLSGTRFGRLVVVRREGTKGKKATWLCLCDCGKEHIVLVSGLKNGHTQSCGCLKIESDAKGSRFKHGQSNSPEHTSWMRMNERCNNKNSKFYSSYGGRGITICDRWLVFENFLADMGQRPTSDHSIDRIDNNGNYEPTNCRWANPREQANNTSKNVRIAINGKTMNMSEWCRETGIDPDLASQRILRDGWSPSDAVTIPPITQGK